MDKNLFEAEGISWEMVKPSLIKCLGADPKKVAQANMLAYLADTVGDQATVADALRPVQFMMDASIWRSKTRWKEIQADFKSGKIK